MPESVRYTAAQSVTKYLDGWRPLMASLIGAHVVRKEDPKLLSGGGTFVDDLRMPGLVHLGLVRSTHAHARLLSVDGAAARDIPGVLGVWTAEDLHELPAMPSVPGLERPCLAQEKVRFVGEPVAVVVATDCYTLADAVDAVVVDYEPLPAVSSVNDALADDAPLVFETVGSNVVWAQPAAQPADAELAASPRRATLRIVNQRCAPVPIEPTSCVAHWTATGLTLWGTVQAPHHFKNILCRAFGLANHEVRVVAPDVGGGFGAKNSFYPEFLLAPALSRRVGRPVKYVETRSENLVAMTHGRDQVHDIEVGFDDDGHLLALRVDIVQNCGGWPAPIGLGLPNLTMFMTGGCYKIPKIAGGFRCVATNTTPIGAYRGAGRPEAAYMIERVVDLVADETGIDPLEVRRRNFIRADEFPYATQLGVVYDSGDYLGALDRLLELVDYEALRKEQAARLLDPTRQLMGIGFSTYVEIAGIGPSAMVEHFGFLGGWESATVRVTPDGSVIVAAGTSPHGQGHATTFSQIAADALGVPFESVTVIHGDTANVQEGIGTFGSRSTAVGGSAVHQTSLQVRQKMVQIAAHLLEANPNDLEVVDGKFQVQGSPGDAVAFTEVANAAYRPTRLPEGFDLGLTATSYFEPANCTFPSGAHCCVVGIDRDTGRVGVERYVAVDDCGTVINPLLAEGQIEGGIAQGIAQALLEQVAYDENGQPLTSTLVDYLVPGAPDLPRYETAHLVTPTPVNPLGAKGLGESGTIGAPPAVVNAVVDALTHLGVRHVDTPVTPQKVWRILSEAEALAR